MELVEKGHDGGFILSVNDALSFEHGTLNSGQDLHAGTVCGFLAVAGAAVAGTNTGNGVVTVGAIGADVELGIYNLRCVAAASNAGTFNFESPDGNLVRQITVGGGASPNSHIVITVADGATDFAVGDSFTIEVTGGDWEQLDVAATTGEQIARGILFSRTDASDADAKAVFVTSLAAVNANELIWPDGITNAQKSAALLQLKRQHIVAR